jgi:phenylalanine-4-hydroxylase
MATIVQPLNDFAAIPAVPNGVFTAPLKRPAHIGEDWLEPHQREYTSDEDAIWNELFDRQMEILPGRACSAFMAGLQKLHLGSRGVPDFGRLSEALGHLTGWSVVPVPMLIPDHVFFWHLANRRFPAGNFIRTRETFDYIQEPDVFHDIFGHVPMLVNPVFADYMQAYGAGGLKALGLGSLHHLARLYWYTVEFGLVRTAAGLRIYGSGIVSSHAESLYALDSARPHRLAFDLMRIMRTEYRIDDVQETYFVIDGYDQLFDATRPDFTPYYATLRQQSDIAPGALLPGDRAIARG